MPRRTDVQLRLLSVLLALAGLVCIAQQPQPARGQLGAPGCGVTVGKLIYQPCASGAAGAVVTIDQIASASVNCASGTSCNFTNQTITGALSNSALVVLLIQTPAVNGSALSVIWDSGGTNQSMTQVCAEQVVNGQSFIYGLKAPTAGNKTLALSWTTTTQYAVSSLSLKNVNQTTPFPNNNNATGSSATPTTTVTSAANDLVVSNWASLANFSGAYSGTQIYLNGMGANWTAAGSYDSGAASVSPTAPTTSSNAWLGCSVDVAHS